MRQGEAEQGRACRLRWPGMDRAWVLPRDRPQRSTPSPTLQGHGQLPVTSLGAVSKNSKEGETLNRAFTEQLCATTERAHSEASQINYFCSKLMFPLFVNMLFNLVSLCQLQRASGPPSPNPPCPASPAYLETLSSLRWAVPARAMCWHPGNPAW